jgi:hypothetical protein
MKKFIFMIFLTFLFGCAHHRDVRPGSEGLHRVVVKAEQKDEGYRDAMSQANHFCEQQKKYAVIVDEKSSYTGSMNEDTYQKTKTASKIAQGVGGAAYVFGGRKESNAGGIVGLGGAIADGVAGQGYTFEMRFKCQ